MKNLNRRAKIRNEGDERKVIQVSWSLFVFDLVAYRFHLRRTKS